MDGQAKDSGSKKEKVDILLRANAQRSNGHLYAAPTRSIVLIIEQGSFLVPTTEYYCREYLGLRSSIRLL